MKKFYIVFLLLLPLFANAHLRGKARLDSLLQELGSPLFAKKEDTAKAMLLVRVAFEHSYINPQVGIGYGKQALKLAEKLNFKEGIAGACNALCVNYEAAGDINAAIAQGLRAIEINEKLKSPYLLGNYGNVANCYEALSDYTKSLEYFFKAAKMAEVANNKPVMALTFMSIGAMYNNLHEYRKGLQNLQKALGMLELLKDSANMGMCLYNTASAYTEIKQFDSALDCANRAFHLFEAQGTKYYIPYAVSLKGLLYKKKGDFPNALNNFEESLELSEQLGFKECISSISMHLGGLYTDLVDSAENNAFKNKNARLISAGKNSNLHKAILYYEKALKIAGEINKPQMIMEVREKLAYCYKLTGDYKAAYAHFEVYKTISDSIFSNDNKLKVAGMETQRETELKDRQIEINKIQEGSKRKERWFFILGSFLLGGGIVSISLSYLKQKRTSANLKLANKELAEEKIKQDVANRLLLDEKQKSDVLAADLKELVSQKEELVAQLAASAEMKSKFLANISHELRTPVTLLTGMLELIKDKTAGDKVKLEVAYNNSRKLQYMVEEILDLSRLETWQTKADLQVKEIAPVMKRMVYAFETLVEKEQLSLQWTEENAQGVFVPVDEQMLEKIVNNLVYNAIKFNVRNGWIRAGLSSAADGSHLIFTISNSGNGIKAEDLPHVFDRYYQGDSPATKAGGMGIGLSLVKEFTELLGGTVNVSSTEELGTTFTLTFPVTGERPVEKEADEDAALLLAEEWAKLPGRHTVLIVEDNADMRYYLKEILDEKVNIAEAGNGREALKWLENNQPDLIITDIMMPELDGREFITQLKSSEAHRKIPVITLTALADKENQLGMLRMGVDDYIVKPFNATELQVRVHNLLKNQEERIQFINQPVEPDDIPEENKDADEFRDKITEYVLARMKTVNVSVYDLAYHLAMSERQLYRLAKTLTGCTPAQLIKEVRLQKAYELLVGGKINKIDDLAKQVGFENTSYFSRQFYERFGKRATEFI